jgi:FKBP-type peptidyl-prolyl cis-trans isomerase
MRRIAPLVLALLGAAACSGDPDVFVPPDPTEIEFAAELNVDFIRMTETATGLWYEELQQGAGDLPVAGDSIYVLYSGWLSDGTLFDSATNPDDPLDFVFLVDAIIAGFAEGVAGMRPGGIRRLVIPPHLGYGSRVFGPIPAWSTLVFEVNVLRIARPQ